MRADPGDDDDFGDVVDAHHQSILVSTDVEDHATTLQDARTPELSLQFAGRAPESVLRFLKPGSQRFLGVWMLRPKRL